MEVTKTTTITWRSESEQHNDALFIARNEQLAKMDAEGKTISSYLLVIDPTTTKRFWRDQSAAEEFIAFITEQAAINNCVIVSAIIEDYVEPV